MVRPTLTFLSASAANDPLPAGLAHDADPRITGLLCWLAAWCEVPAIYEAETAQRQREADDLVSSIENAARYGEWRSTQDGYAAYRQDP